MLGTVKCRQLPHKFLQNVLWPLHAPSCKSGRHCVFKFVVACLCQLVAYVSYIASLLRVRVQHYSCNVVTLIPYINIFSHLASYCKYDKRSEYPIDWTWKIRNWKLWLRLQESSTIILSCGQKKHISLTWLQNIISDQMHSFQNKIFFSFFPQSMPLHRENNFSGNWYQH